MTFEERIEKIVPKRLRELKPYRAESASGLVKMDAMELPFPLAEETLEELHHSLREVALNRYPDPKSEKLRGRLLKANGLSEGVDVILGNGSDELILLLCLLTAGSPNSAMLCPGPTFSVYKIAAEIVGLRYIEVSTSFDDFDLDVERIIEVAKAVSPSLIFLASPNNPTGKAIRRIDLERICRSTQGLVILDEAYWRFSQRSFVSLVESFENLLVLQTLSKVGFAGLRVGMLYGLKPWVDLIEKIRMPYNINSLSQAGAMFVLEQEKLVLENIKELIKEREWMWEQLSVFKNLKVWPSEANFILVRPKGKSGPEVFNRLKSKGFLVKDLSGSHPALTDCLRITIGSHRENTGFIAALKALCG